MNTNKTLIDYILQNRFITHFLFWCSFGLLFTILASLNSGSFKTDVFNSLAMLPSQMLAAYFLNYYQIPKLLFNKRYILFGVSIVISIYIFSALARICVVHIAEPLIREDFSQETIEEIFSDSAYLFSIYFPGVYVYGFMMLIIKAFKTRFEEKHKIEILQKEKVTNELKFLKAQIQPHFLFNTLNNLYALTLSKSDLAPKVVIKLSELLDFMLYQSNESRIPIHKEIELIEGFIDLEKLRHGNSLNVVFNFKEDSSNVYIAPFTLFPLIENGFKHGTGGNLKNSEIRIDLEVKKHTLSIEVFNKKAHKNLENEATKRGIGNYNLKRQLALNYPDTYQLEVKDLADSYFVNLHIDLKNNK